MPNVSQPGIHIREREQVWPKKQVWLPITSDEESAQTFFLHLLPAVTSKYCPQWDSWCQCIQNGLVQHVPRFSDRYRGCSLLMEWKRWEFSLFPKTVVGKALQVIHSPLVFVTIVIHYSFGQLSKALPPQLGVVVGLP